MKTGRDVQLAEVGPRLDMKRMFKCSPLQGEGTDATAAYEIRQGTIEQAEAEKEWVLSHYTRTAKKRNVLTGPTISEPPSKRARAS